MKKILFDTNIIIDWLLERNPFFEASKRCINLCKDEKIEGFLTPHSISDLFYLICKEKGTKETKECVNLLLNIFGILTEEELTFQNIVESDEWKNDVWKDIEDSLQMTSALMSDMDFILTRNPKDFALSKVRCLSPEEMITAAAASYSTDR